MALLNRTDALQRMGGSTSLLDRLSTQFLADLPKYIEACESTPLDAQREQAQRSLHSLRGMAATIGADSLATFAGEAEQSCRAGLAINVEHLRHLAARTEQALLEIGVAAPLESSPSDETADAVLTPLSTAERGVMERLLPLLQASDLSALDAMEELLALSTEDKKRWAALDREVQILAFDRATHFVRRLLDRT